MILKDFVRNDTNAQKIDSFLKKVENIRSGRDDSILNTTNQIEPKKSLKRKVELNETVTGYWFTNLLRLLFVYIFMQKFKPKKKSSETSKT